MQTSPEISPNHRVPREPHYAHLKERRSYRKRTLDPNVHEVAVYEHSPSDGPVSERVRELAGRLLEVAEELTHPELPPVENTLDYYSELRRFEISLIKRALRRTGGSQTKAAELLRINLTTLNTKIKGFGIEIFAIDES
jgi:DNA-binding NtrC family response regulator